MSKPNHSEQSNATSAPYNFVPLPEWVFTPDWEAPPSQDRPFRDGVSGTLAYTLVAETPLLVGGHQKPRSDRDRTPGEVHPFRLGDDGPYAIPGSSLKGMLRAVVEIAAFGRMRMVDNQRLSVRDLTAGARAFYGNRMTENRNGAFRPKPKAGWLRIEPGTGKARITPCQYARVEHDDLAALSGNKEWKALGRAPLAKKKYDRWRKDGRELTVHFTPGPKEPHDHSKGKKLVYRLATDLGSGQTEGTLVFTGQPSARTDRQGNRPAGRKHMEFIFFDCEEENALEVPERVWRDFLHIHAESDDWKAWRKEPAVPVFYLPDGEGGIHSMGLAMMYRLAYDHTIHDAIGHTNPEHLALPDAEHGYDLADLLFGTVGDEQEYALRGRVACEYATAEGNPEPMAAQTTILSAPKPTYYPNYVVQPTDGRGGLKGNGYATFMDKDVTICGFKRYPARPQDYVAVQKVASDQQDNYKYLVKLHPLREGARFRGRIGFHNLRPAELGALLWAMTWGGDECLRHGLGMGKPFGFGQVRLEIDPAASEIVPNDPEAPRPAVDNAVLQEYRQAFTDLMEAEHERRGGPWAESPQIVNLLVMADPANAPAYEKRTDTRLQHPRLEKRTNEFQDAKNARRVLPDYAAALGVAISQPARDAGGGNRYGHPWLDETIPRLMQEHNASDEDVIRGKVLAKTWWALEEGDQREAVREAIRSLWEERRLLNNMPRAQKRLIRDYYGWLG
ncbi:TIGR03986 family type III CRISPR-associated RAMP protein [Alkalilimnicola ehrlichii]|uniref:TIGR03986 family type III CRISPR-associated RAMP protein n=1 Tax=Alkalilimnicola ehrlichii TaxID=351052 RepID=UPI003B9EB3FA